MVFFLLALHPLRVTIFLLKVPPEFPAVCVDIFFLCQFWSLRRPNVRGQVMREWTSGVDGFQRMTLFGDLR
jgi:hypothetical protein